MSVIGKILPAGIILSTLVLSGCGPGSFIMTAEQEALEKNVERLLKDNEDLKTRVQKLEKGGTDAGGLEEVKASALEAAASLDEIRQEVSFIRGSVEASEHKLAEVNAVLSPIRDDLNGLKQRLDVLEASSGKTGEIESVRKSILESEKKLTELSERVSALEREAQAKAAKGEDPEELYLRGYEAAKNKEYEKAEESLGRFLSQYPEHKLADHARYWLGETYYSKGDWERAILEFNRVIKDYPGGEKVPGAILKQAMSFQKLGSKKEARVLFEQVIERFPASPEAELAKKHLEGLK